MNPLVSIALATYNGQKFLEEQLDSIYNQTYKNIEVVVCDDKSDDLTVDILKKYQKLYGLTYSINEVRLGVAKNFEKIVFYCKGKYILLSDQDDIWFPEKIERLLYNIGTASMIYSDGLIFHGDKSLSKEKLSNCTFIRLFGMDSSNEDFLKFAVLNSFILGCSVMFDRIILKNAIPFYESNYNHDWWLVLCAQNENGVKYLNEVLFSYRIHDNNYSFREKNSIEKEGKRKNRMYKKLLSFNSPEKLYERYKKKLVIYHIATRFKNGQHHQFFSDLQAYSISQKKILNIKDFLIVLKYRNFFFPNDSFLFRSYMVITSIFK